MDSGNYEISIQEKAFLASAKDTNAKHRVKQQFSIGKTNYGQKGAYTQDRR